MDAYIKQIVGGLICTVADTIIAVDSICDILEDRGLVTEHEAYELIRGYRECDSYKELISLGERLISESATDAIKKVMNGEASKEELDMFEKFTSFNRESES